MDHSRRQVTEGENCLGSFKETGHRGPRFEALKMPAGCSTAAGSASHLPFDFDCHLVHCACGWNARVNPSVETGVGLWLLTASTAGLRGYCMTARCFDWLPLTPPQVILWVTMGEPVFLHIHTCSIFKFSRRPGVYKILVMAVHRARARAAARARPLNFHLF